MSTGIITGGHHHRLASSRTGEAQDFSFHCQPPAENMTQQEQEDQEIVLEEPNSPRQYPEMGLTSNWYIKRSGYGFGHMADWVVWRTMCNLNYFINFHNTSVSHRIMMLTETYLRESAFFSYIDTAASRTRPLWIVSIFSFGICHVEEGWLRGKKTRIQCFISQGLTEYYILLFTSALSSLDAQHTLLGRDKQLSLGCCCCC